MPVLPKTTTARKETVEPNWYTLDADGQIVGRLATSIATVLMGKHKPEYTPHVDCGDYVVVTNVERVKFGGNAMEHPEIPNYSKKWDLKTYDRYSGYPGGRTVNTAAEVWARKPEMILREAVRRMLPKNKLGRAMLNKLKLYVGTDHPHQAQGPEAFPEYV
ncbi:50S ribosomal protein L13 [Calycomorphotria hydatis]|uniref:Large ribosomal subunit protein uL13 n=1 Tax=Calycomorphotria hydatis TaxID=2528027 RepID=A0A517TCN3_9PLAN|nr:50S ribosomal protein L13 [Calycomorphotria hydatis]QDT66127.1 50S ribosomal protein L13 [Calycomorphotria hydatis]